jgi:glycosyltransferase involved in cell wall biosynthesis
LLDQGFTDWSLVVVDDSAGDDTERWLRANLSLDRLDYLRVEPGYSIGHKRNLACERARTDVIAFTDDDDWFPPTRLEQALDVLARGYPVALHGRYTWLDFRSLALSPTVDTAASDDPIAFHGSMVFPRETWLAQPFDDSSFGEDTAFLAALGGPACWGRIERFFPEGPGGVPTSHGRNGVNGAPLFGVVDVPGLERLLGPASLERLVIARRAIQGAWPEGLRPFGPLGAYVARAGTRRIHVVGTVDAPETSYVLREAGDAHEVERLGAPPASGTDLLIVGHEMPDAAPRALELAAALPDDARLALIADDATVDAVRDHLPPEVERVDDVPAPRGRFLLLRRHVSRPRWSFAFGPTPLPFRPDSPFDEGCGSAESTLFALGSALARSGSVDVRVTWDAARPECRGGLAIEPTTWLGHDDLLVAWRGTALPEAFRDARQVAHRAHSGLAGTPPSIAVVASSASLGAWLRGAGYTVLDTIAPAVDLAPVRASLGRPRRPVVIYASSPGPTLTALLAAWPAVRRARPDAELWIAYGLRTFDHFGGDRTQLRDWLLAMRQPGVRFVGRVGEWRLAELLCEARAWVSPFEGREVSAGGWRAMAAGLVPVFRRVGAADELHEGGLVLDDDPFAPGASAELVDRLVCALQEGPRVEALRADLSARAFATADADVVAARWLDLGRRLGWLEPRRS